MSPTAVWVVISVVLSIVWLVTFVFLMNEKENVRQEKSRADRADNSRRDWKQIADDLQRRNEKADDLQRRNEKLAKQQRRIREILDDENE